MCCCASCQSRALRPQRHIASSTSVGIAVTFCAKSHSIIPGDATPRKDEQADRSVEPAQHAACLDRKASHSQPLPLLNRALAVGSVLKEMVIGGYWDVIQPRFRTTWMPLLFRQSLMLRLNICQGSLSRRSASENRIEPKASWRLNGHLANDHF